MENSLEKHHLEGFFFFNGIDIRKIKIVLSAEVCTEVASCQGV